MNFTDLADIIAYIEVFVPCRGCKKKYTPNNIIVIASMPMECLLAAQCPGCDVQALLNVIFTDESSPDEAKGSRKSIDVRTKGSARISSNDVLDIKNFLKSFEGDFREIFS